MPPTSKRAKKPPKLALKTSEDAQSILFGEQPQQQADDGDDENVEGQAPTDDPLAAFRKASSAAGKAVRQEAEKRSEIERHLLCVFDEMDAASTSPGPGRVLLNDVLEAVSRGTAPLTSRARTSRPSKAVALQLPPVFSRDQFLTEMDRVAKLMDDKTFEANVLGLFACFYEPIVAHTQRERLGEDAAPETAAN